MKAIGAHCWKSDHCNYFGDNRYVESWLNFFEKGEKKCQSPPPCGRPFFRANTLPASHLKCPFKKILHMPLIVPIWLSALKLCYDQNMDSNVYFSFHFCIGWCLLHACKRNQERCKYFTIYCWIFLVNLFFSCSIYCLCTIFSMLHKFLSPLALSGK